jgi:hypothetical protein
MRFMNGCALAAVVAVTAACSDSASPEEALPGIYTLRSINGRLPYPLEDRLPNYKLEILESTLAIAYGRWSETLNLRITEGTNVLTYTTDRSGSYTIDGKSVIISAGLACSLCAGDGGGKVTVTFTGGNTLTATSVGAETTMKFVYRK